MTRRVAVLERQKLNAVDALAAIDHPLADRRRLALLDDSVLGEAMAAALVQRGDERAAARLLYPLRQPALLLTFYKRFATLL